MEAYITEMKSKFQYYQPVKGDPVDRKLAEYLNAYPDKTKLKVMFYRQSPGVYEFGQTKINLKVSGERLVVRVGGGFLSIDEFIDQYTPVEYDKIHSRSPVKQRTSISSLNISRRESEINITR